MKLESMTISLEPAFSYGLVPQEGLWTVLFDYTSVPIFSLLHDYLYRPY
jgi:hypothetical protein